MEGIIKMYNDQKGYGFIKSNDEDIFFHISDVKNREIIPRVKACVQFDIVNENRGKKAINIFLAEQKKNACFYNN